MMFKFIHLKFKMRQLGEESTPQSLEILPSPGGVLQRAAVWCSVLLSVALCCSVMSYVEPGAALDLLVCLSSGTVVVCVEQEWIGSAGGSSRVPLNSTKT